MADEKKFEVVGPVQIVTTGKKEVKREEFESALDGIPTGTGASLEDMYDRFSRLVYLIDASGSMGDGMAADNGPKKYDWTDELLEDGRALLIEQVEDGAGILDPESGVDFTPAKVKKLTTDQVKRVLEEVSFLMNELAVPEVQVVPAVGQRNKTKMQAVKEAASGFVKKRFEKFPDARVTVFSFEGHPSLLSAGVTEEHVLQAINSLPDMGGGSTNIYSAVERAVNECKKRVQQVGMHHIVLVSDGMDGGATQVISLLPMMLEVGIVFDFIFILGGSEYADQHVIDALKKVCEATGGEFVTVKTEKDFVEKFLKASSRLCLPTAPAQLKK
jgi:Mg-chelatase subunit ChlD